MKKFFFTLGRHWAILVLLLFVVLIYTAPQFWLKNSLGGEYQGIYVAVSDSEMYYAARIHDIYDGHFKLANAFLYEYKNFPYIQPALPEILSAGLGYLVFWADIPTKIFFATRVAVPVLVGLLIYLFFWRLTKSKTQGVVGAAVIMLGIEFLQNYHLFYQLFQNGWPNDRMIDFVRPISPQYGILFLFLYMIFFWEWLEKGKSKFLLSAGMVLGLSVYVYFYTWTFILVSNGLMFFYFLKVNKQKAWQLLKMHVLPLLVVLPYLYNLYQFYQIENRAFLAYHAGQFPSHRFIMNWTIVGGLILALLAWKGKGIKFWWLVSFLLGGFIALNQQVITGQELTPAHYHWYFIAPVVGVVAVLFIYKFFHLEGKNLQKYIFSILVITALIGYGYAKHRHSYEYYYDGLVSEQRFGKLYDWLNSNTPADSVVLMSDRNRADQLAAYTSNNVYYASFMFLSNTPTQRLRDMHNLNLYLSGATADNIDKYLRDHPGIVANFIGGFSTRRTTGCRTCFQDEEFQKAADSFREFSGQDLSDIMRKYKLDYIVHDNVTDAWKESDLPGLRLKDRVGEFTIYEMVKN